MGNAELFYETQKQLRLRGENLTKAARLYGTSRSNLSKALLGTWTGPKARFLVESITRYLGIQASNKAPASNKEAG